MTAQKALESFDSRAVAKALFPNPVTARDGVEIEKTRGKKSKDVPLANAFKNSVIQIKNELRDVYNLNCAVRYGSAIWQSTSENNGTIKFHCDKCMKAKLVEGGSPGKEDLIALAVCKGKTKEDASVTVKKVFLHDSHNMKGKDKETRHPQHGWETLDFPFDRILGDTYGPAVQEINQYPVGGKKLPPGSRIKFDGANEQQKTSENIEFYEDRIYCVLQDQSVFPSISAEKHDQCIIRLMFFLAAVYNMAKEVAPTIGPDNLFTSAWSDDDDKADDKELNPEKHLSLTEVSLIYGGHHLYGNSVTPIHQPLHTDFSSPVKNVPKSMATKFKPASFLIPLKTSRFLHIQTYGNLVEVKKGQILFFSGDLFHAGHTWKDTDNDWKVAIHGHVDSNLWTRDEGTVSMGWDHDLTKSNAMCISKYSSAEGILKELGANIEASAYLLAGAEKKSKGLKLESKRKLKKTLAELKHATELLKAITAELD